MHFQHGALGEEVLVRSRGMWQLPLLKRRAGNMDQPVVTQEESGANTEERNHDKTDYDSQDCGSGVLQQNADYKWRASLQDSMSVSYLRILFSPGLSRNYARRAGRVSDTVQLMVESLAPCGVGRDQSLFSTGGRIAAERSWATVNSWRLLAIAGVFVQPFPKSGVTPDAINIFKLCHIQQRATNIPRSAWLKMKRNLREIEPAGNCLDYFTGGMPDTGPDIEYAVTRWRSENPGDRLRNVVDINIIAHLAAIAKNREWLPRPGRSNKMIDQALFLVGPLEWAVRVRNAKNCKWLVALVVKSLKELFQQRAKGSVTRLGIQGMLFSNGDAIRILAINCSARRNKN